MLPKVILHNAVSLDGRIDWFKVDVGLFYKLVSVWKEDATLAGSDTIISSQEEIPKENEVVFEKPKKGPDDKRPLLVIPDSRGRIRSWHFLRQQPYWKDHIALCSKSTPMDYLDYLKSRHFEYIIAGEDHVDLKVALEELNLRYGVKTVRVDSGGTLNGILLRIGLVNEVSLLIHPDLVGGKSPKSIFRASDLVSEEKVVKLRLIHFEKLENDIIWLRYEVQKK